MRASDVMTVGAASIKSTAPIEEAARLMVRCRISGLPVVDEDGNLIGIVTERDLLRPRSGASSQERPQWLEFLLGSKGWDDRAGSAQLLSVADVMTSDVITASEDTPIIDIADTMERHGIKRIPVVQDGKVKGIISRADLLRGLARHAEEMPSANAEDRELRQRVIRALSHDVRAGWRTMNVVVRGGSVELRGALMDEGVRARLLSAVRGVAGVKQVEDRLIVVDPSSAST
ncbi:MAG: CBS domain-containing protein [Hyphomicrobiaceae bacterium]